MVRKTREDARDALLTAALQTFRERGVAHTRLSDVAARAGVTRGAIYWHFKDKAELFAAVCERGTLPVEALLAEASRTATTLLERVEYPAASSACGERLAKRRPCLLRPWF